jgi:phosphopantetheinyl transferase
MPIIFNHQPDEGTSVAVWEITEPEETLRAILPPLKEPEQQLLQRLSFEPRRLEWLASRVLLNQLSGHYPAVTYNSNGQPTLNDPRLKVSISHTRGYAAIALSTTQMPGIDIEYPSSRIEKVADRFMNPAESIFSSAHKQSDQLALIWCAKEAIYKMTGQPGLIFKKDIVVDPFIPQQKGAIRATLQPGTHNQIINLEYIVTPQYYLIYSFDPH